MEFGKDQEELVRQAERHKQKLPSYLIAPELRFGLDIYYEAFMKLSTCRSIGMGAGPIPFTAIIEYAKIYEFSMEQFEDLEYFVRGMDGFYLKKVNEKRSDISSKANRNRY